MAPRAKIGKNWNLDLFFIYLFLWQAGVCMYSWKHMLTYDNTLYMHMNTCCHTLSPAQTHPHTRPHALPQHLCCRSSSTCGYYRSHLSLALSFMPLLPHYTADRFYSPVVPRDSPPTPSPLSPSHIHTYTRTLTERCISAH